VTGPAAAQTENVLYRFRHSIVGFFEFPTANAVKILPSSLQPVEPHHGQSVLSVMAFDFHDSMVGAYGELIFCVGVAPRIEAGRLPRGAFYPFLLGTTTRASREHAIERWHLPHFMEDIELDFQSHNGQIRMEAAHGGSPIAGMTITDYGWEPVEHLYQSFMKDASGAYMAKILMAAPFSEHEEERGELELHEHAFTALVDRDGVTTTPFRELWMKDGLQTFHPLQQLSHPAT
jgi:hypothetical protein